MVQQQFDHFLLGFDLLLEQFNLLLLRLILLIRFLSRRQLVPQVLNVLLQPSQLRLGRSRRNTLTIWRGKGRSAEGDRFLAMDSSRRKQQRRRSDEKDLEQETHGNSSQNWAKMDLIPEEIPLCPATESFSPGVSEPVPEGMAAANTKYASNSKSFIPHLAEDGYAVYRPLQYRLAL
jgi:hypothetical protein